MTEPEGGPQPSGRGHPTIKATPGIGSRECEACGGAVMVPIADIGEVPVFCGVHWSDAAEAAASPVGQMILGYCPECAYVRNLAFDPAVMVYDTTMDTNLHHSPAFQKFSRELVSHLADGYVGEGQRVVDVGCGQGEFLRELCHKVGCSGVGYDAMYAGPVGADGSGAAFHSSFAPRGAQLPDFDLFTSRHWLEHLADPYDFLVDLRVRAGDRPVFGYLEVPDACYDLATAGWEVIYPHVSYFDAYSLSSLVTRAGWRVEEAGTWFSGMFRFIIVSANQLDRVGPARPTLADRDRQLAAVREFADRQEAERTRWRRRIASLADAGARPVLWGAGSRAVQFLTQADPHQRLAAVVDVNPRKWGRFLPVTAHQVQSPEYLAQLQPSAVILTNPAYRAEIAAELTRLGVQAELLQA